VFPGAQYWGELLGGGVPRQPETPALPRAAPGRMKRKWNGCYFLLKTVGHIDPRQVRRRTANSPAATIVHMADLRTIPNHDGPVSCPKWLPPYPRSPAPSEMVRRKSASPVELTRQCVQRIEKYNPVLNAFITVMAEQAMAQAQELEGRTPEGEAARTAARRFPSH